MLIITLFIYGLAFFFLGTAVALQSRRGSALALKKSLWALALFGLAHGTVEWLDMFSALGETYWSHETFLFFRAAAPVLKIFSFFALFWFGASCIATLHPERAKVWIVPWLSLLALLFAFVVFRNLGATRDRWFLYFNPCIRYFVGIPSSLLSAIALFSFARDPETRKLGGAKVKAGLMGLGIAFLAYSFFAGVITEPGPWFASAVLNGETFARVTGLPIQLVRAGCAVASAYFVIWILKTFDIESREILRREKEVAERKTAELRRTQLQLVQSAKLASLGELSAGVSHEIIQPLFRIQGYTDRINSVFERNETIQREQLADPVKGINENLARIARVVEHIRDFSRQSKQELAPVRVNPVIESSLRLLGEQLRLQEIVVSLELDPRNPAVLANKDQLEQAFAAFLSNSRDAIEASTRKDAGRIAIRTKAERQSVTIEFSDNGCGIDPSIINRVFDPFFTTKDPGKGTGLGLSITHGIIQEHQGKLGCASVPGEGATFRIVLPALNELVSPPPES